MDVFMTNLRIQLVFTALSLLYYLVSPLHVELGFGWFPIILVWEFHRAAINPEQERRFCCLPFLIKNKYFPFVLTLLFLIMSQQVILCLSYGLLGYVEAFVLKRKLFDLPASAYYCLEGILPGFITNRPDFTFIRNAPDVPFAAQAQPSRNDFNANPRRRDPESRRNNANAEEEPKPDKIGNPFSKGVSIGGGSSAQPMSYQDVWKMREKEQANTKA